MPAESEWFILRVRNPDGIVSKYQVVRTDTVAQLKQQIEQDQGVSVQEQRLLCGGVLMVEDRSLGSYKLGETSSILLVPHIRAKEQAGKEKALSAKRGLLMVPELDAPWDPHTTAKIHPNDVVGFFESKTSIPPPWLAKPMP
uniref:Ubiquitin-like domain-containing protein n=1 Tax=Noctiluca scintillans TaxID=2966 RepID=A0A7S1A2U9_NOCSC